MKNAIRSILAITFATLCLPKIVAAHEPVQIRVATPFATGHILADTANKFKELIETRYPSQFQVTVATGVLNEQTINPAMQSCEASDRVADIILTGPQPIQDYAPAYFFVNGPYVLRDFQHFQAVWEGELGEAIVHLLKSNGNFVSLEPVYRGFRQFTSNAPIQGPADFVGMKLRLPPVPDWISVWSSLGVVPVTVPLTGIYAALQDGSAEASEGDLTQIVSLKLNEVQSHLTLTNHLVGFGLPLVNRCFFHQTLKGNQKSKVRAMMKKAAKWGTQKVIDNETNLQNQLAAAGMTLVTPDAAAIRAAAKPAIDQLFATKWTVTTWEEVLDE